MTIRYITDETGLTFELIEESGKVSIRLANQLCVENGKVIALPFDIPK